MNKQALQKAIKMLEELSLSMTERFVIYPPIPTWKSSLDYVIGYLEGLTTNLPDQD